MYWYKRYLAFLTGLVVLMTAGCKPDTSSPGRANYFDLKGYFQAEAARMAKRDPAIVKPSIHNGNSETQHLHISDWQSEFSLFIASDINNLKAGLNLLKILSKRLFKFLTLLANIILY